MMTVMLDVLIHKHLFCFHTVCMYLKKIPKHHQDSRTSTAESYLFIYFLALTEVFSPSGGLFIVCHHTKLFTH